MNINYLMGLCLVAVSGAVAVNFITWCVNSYPVSFSVAVIIIVAGWIYSWFLDYKRRTG